MEKNYKVLVLDMQPIDPPIGGGRLRLLGLYHDLGLPTTYIGSFDWPGEQSRNRRLSDTLREIDIPLSDQHFQVCQEWQQKLAGKIIIDSTFHQLAHYSTEYVRCVQDEVKKSDIVIFSHPWVYPIVKKHIDKTRQLIVYDSQNVEGYLRFTLLDDNGGFGTEIIKEVTKIEFELCQFSDIVLACSHEDRELFNKLYNISFDKIRLVPNGVFTERLKPVAPEIKVEAKRQLKLDKYDFYAIFIGSAYGPNIEAAKFICDELAPRFPKIGFIIAGSVGELLKESLKNQSYRNILLTGVISDEDKLKYLAACDIAINPMFSGSGTNIKMFDFMAVGLPIICTSIGARGIDIYSEKPFIIAEKTDFISCFQRTIEKKDFSESLSRASRRLVEEKYSWEKISSDLGKLLIKTTKSKFNRKPFFSVVIPTYERHDSLFELMTRLTTQQYRDFEVIIIDQSENEWIYTNHDFGFNLFYFHTTVRGAVKARNKGAFFASGEVLAFIDDDCIPSFDWLENAKKYFNNPNTIGLEGLIKSDKYDDPSYRIVSNESFEGIGFMTANLFIRLEAFNRINGFDEKFDNPHFREDTDLGWRALSHGQIPFGKDVCVLHPALPRNKERESLKERSKFFEKDALLYQKHPERYKELFLAEKHWERTPYFCEHFIRGHKIYEVPLNPFFFQYLNITESHEKIAEHSDTEHNTTIEDFGKIEGELEFFSCLTRWAKIALPKVPEDIQTRLPKARDIVRMIQDEVAGKTHGAYFESSTSRYVYYIAIASALSRNSLILDLGNAPGHVAIGLHFLGHQVQGVNLNTVWRETYPDEKWLSEFNVIECDVEKCSLPFPAEKFDAVLFTEILEHIAVTDPADIMNEIWRVLRPGGQIILSTPNVCNISNIYALVHGKNIFWPPSMFYGSTDRHNREYTPSEVFDLLDKSGFGSISIFGINCDSNWNSEGSEFSYRLLEVIDENNPIMLNTIIALAIK